MATKTLTVDFSGTVTLPLEQVEFESTIEEGKVITGTQYVGLSDEQRQNYVLKSVADCIADSMTEYDYCEVSLNEEES